MLNMGETANEGCTLAEDTLADTLSNLDTATQAKQNRSVQILPPSADEISKSLT
jgi:hypothetical protein